MVKRWLVLTGLLFFLHSAYSQCEDSVVNCTGECGQFIDENGDGYCDDSIIDSSRFKKTIPLLIKDTSSKKDSRKTAAKKDTLRSKVPKQNSITPIETTYRYVSETRALQAEIKSVPPVVKAERKKKSSPYHFFSVVLPLLVLYLVMDRMVKIKKITKANFLKLWNVALLITFVGSAVLGLFLVIKINYHLQLPWMKLIYIIHVDFGIAMSIISLFHVIKHWKYYSRIFSPKHTAH